MFISFSYLVEYRLIVTYFYSQYELHNKGFSNCKSLNSAIMQVENEEINNSESILYLKKRQNIIKEK